jgi:nucleotidyltransferase/DNA polymerase involved in DNA repair
VTENRRGLPSAWATTNEISARILEETGLTVSAGISYIEPLALEEAYLVSNIAAADIAEAKPFC